MRLAAHVLHNVSTDMFFGYKPESSELHHAHTFLVDADDLELAANLIWILTNVDSANTLRLEYPHLAQYATEVANYRNRKNRSLSVGDVIAFSSMGKSLGALAVVSIGHEPAEIDQKILDSVSNAGPESDAYLALRAFIDQQPASSRP